MASRLRAKEILSAKQRAYCELLHAQGKPIPAELRETWSRRATEATESPAAPIVDEPHVLIRPSPHAAVNRRVFPELAEFVDECRRVFGEGAYLRWIHVRQSQASAVQSRLDAGAPD